MHCTGSGGTACCCFADHHLTRDLYLSSQVRIIAPPRCVARVAGCAWSQASWCHSSPSSGDVVCLCGACRAARRAGSATLTAEVVPGALAADEAGAAGDLPSTVAGARWAFSVRPVSGWGAPQAQQRATAGWLAALPVFEPHWQARAAQAARDAWLRLPLRLGDASHVGTPSMMPGASAMQGSPGASAGVAQ